MDAAPDPYRQTSPNVESDPGDVGFPHRNVGIDRPYAGRSGESQPLVAKFAVADAVTLAKGNTVGQRNALSRGDRFNPVRSLRRAPSIDHT